MLLPYYHRRLSLSNISSLQLYEKCRGLFFNYRNQILTRRFFNMYVFGKG